MFYMLGALSIALLFIVVTCRHRARADHLHLPVRMHSQSSSILMPGSYTILSQGLNISQNLYLIELISHRPISHSNISEHSNISHQYLTHLISQLACSISQLFLNFEISHKVNISACLTNISPSLETWPQAEFFYESAA